MYRVLLVEDDSALRFSYSKMKTWSECGFSIEAEASDGRRALDILEKESFDLIFTDIRMQFVDGIEMLRELSAKGNTTPVVFASSYDEFEYARQGLILGAFDYLLKPVDQKKLCEVLLRVKKRIGELTDMKTVDPLISRAIEKLGISMAGDNFIEQVVKYCSAHYREELSVDDCAVLFGYSKDHFAKVFKQRFGITFHEFCSNVKIDYAIELLRTGHYKAYEISDMLGYSSVDYFTKVFKSITGTTPSKYKFGVESDKK